MDAINTESYRDEIEKILQEYEFSLEDISFVDVLEGEGNPLRVAKVERLGGAAPSWGYGARRHRVYFVFDGAFAPRKSGLVLSSMRSRGALVPYRRIRVPHMEGFANRPSVVTLATMATY